MRHHYDEQRNSQVLSKLISQERHAAQVDLAKLQSRRIVINEGRLCPVCGQKIAAGMAFGVYPDGTVVHYHCLKDDGTGFG